MSKEKKGLKRVNYYDGQKLTQEDLSTEQSFNVENFNHNNKFFKGSGILKKSPLSTEVLFDIQNPEKYSKVPTGTKDIVNSGFFDGTLLKADKNISDMVYGKRLVFELSNSKSMGADSSKVLLFGETYCGSTSNYYLDYEVINLTDGEKILTEKMYTNIIGFFLNNCSGSSLYSDGSLKFNKNNFNSKTKFIIREETDLEVFSKSDLVKSIKSPSFDLINFYSNSTTDSILDQVREEVSGVYNFSDLPIDLSGLDLLVLEKNKSVLFSFGQKFKSKSNNIQALEVYLSLSDASEYSGDLVFSVHELIEQPNCINGVSPNLMIDYDPNPDSLAEVSLDFKDLSDFGFVLNSNPQKVKIPFSNFEIANPNSGIIKEGKYYAFMIRRTGDTSLGNIGISNGYPLKYLKNNLGILLTPEETYSLDESFLTQYSPSERRYVDNKEISLWHKIHSISAEITPGEYFSENGVLVSIPDTIRYIGGYNIPNNENIIHFNSIPSNLYISADDKIKNVDPGTHPRTGNFVYKNKQDVSSFIHLNGNDITKSDFPNLISKIDDRNNRSAKNIIGAFNKPGMVNRDYFYIVEPSSEILSRNLEGMYIIADSFCNCDQKYKIIKVECYKEKYGDLDNNKIIDQNDLLLAIDLSGETINSRETEKKLLAGEIDYLDFVKCDINSDDTIDGLDVESIERATNGIISGLVNSTVTYLKVYVESQTSHFPMLKEFSEQDSLAKISSNVFTTELDLEDCLKVRPFDKIVIKTGLNIGTYSILSKSISSDEKTVSFELTSYDIRSDDDESKYLDVPKDLIDDSGFAFSIESGSRTNLLFENSSLTSIPFKKSEFTIFLPFSDFENRHVNVQSVSKDVAVVFPERVDESCLCDDEVCDPKDLSNQIKNQHYFPNDIYIPNGEIYSKPGVPYHGDIEYSNIRVPLPPGSIEDCKLNLYDAFIKSKDGSCLTAAGYDALKYSDGTYVGCEDFGENTDISKNRVKIGHAIASLYLDGLISTNIDGYVPADSPTSTAIGYSKQEIQESYFEYEYKNFSSFKIDPGSDLNYFTIDKPNSNSSYMDISLITTSILNKKYLKSSLPISDYSSPLYVNGTRSSDGINGYYYPLYLTQSLANQADTTGTGSEKYTFDEFPGLKFYLPNSIKVNNINPVPGSSKPNTITEYDSSNIGAIYGDFIVDFNASRVLWENTKDGVVRFYSELNVNNEGGSSKVRLGWTQKDESLKYFFEGENYDNLGNLIYEFYFETDSVDRKVDTAKFRLRRINDVITAYYYIPKRNDPIGNYSEEYIRIGSNTSKHAGFGLCNLSFSMDQELSPESSKNFKVRVNSLYVKSNYNSNIVSGSNPISIYRDNNFVKSSLVTVPISLDRTTRLVKAYIHLTPEEDISSPSFIKIKPIEANHMSNISELYNNVVSENSSAFETFTLSGLKKDVPAKIEITNLVSVLTSSKTHLPGFIKGLLIIPENNTGSEFVMSNSIKLEIVYEDTDVGVMFKVGVFLDPKTGIASFRTKNVMYDSLIKENRTVIEFSVFLKKSGFINNDIYVDIEDTKNIGLGTCYEEEKIDPEEECYFIAGSTATGTFVQGPFPCAFHFPKLSAQEVLLAEEVSGQLKSSYYVTVGSSSSTGSNVYYIDGSESPIINLLSGGLYIFDQSNQTNMPNSPIGHPMIISDLKSTDVSDGTGSAAYSYGISHYIDGDLVTLDEYIASVSSGNYSSAYFIFQVPSDTPEKLYYHCSNHKGMAQSGYIKITKQSTTSVTDSSSSSSSSSSEY